MYSDLERHDSWGGMIGGTFAATHPDRIGHAVLMADFLAR
jgi:pimeloyl-ACP methyl ester carboxylesterase